MPHEPGDEDNWRRDLVYRGLSVAQWKITIALWTAQRDKLIAMRGRPARERGDVTLKDIDTGISIYNGILRTIEEQEPANVTARRDAARAERQGTDGNTPDVPANGADNGADSAGADAQRRN